MKEVLDLAKLALLIVSPFAIVAIAWAIILRVTKRKKPAIKTVSIEKIPPPYIARRVMYKEELDGIKPAHGDMAYVLKENHTYFYNGDEWLKVEQKHYPKTDGTVGN